MYLVKNRQWPKAQEAAGCLDFKRERRKREWYGTKGERWVRWNVYAINLGRGMVDSVGFPLIGTGQGM
jgi:hypothetical protein